MIFLYTMPLARPAEAKIQILTTSSRSVTIHFKSLLKSLGLYNVQFLSTFLGVIQQLRGQNFANLWPLTIENVNARG